MDYFKDRATSVYRAKVVNNIDPSNLGKVQIRINALHGVVRPNEDYVSDHNLPWAIPGILSSAGNDTGQFLIPVVGSFVFVIFEDGDPGRPVYLGGIPSLIGKPKKYNTNNDNVLQGEVLVTTKDSPTEVSDPASQGVIYKSLKGMTIMYDDTDGQESVTIIDQAGQQIIMNSTEPVVSRRGDRVLVKRGKIQLITSPTTSYEVTDGVVTTKLPFKV